MNAIDTKYVRIFRKLELSIYLVLATLFIGHVFFLASQMSAGNIVLIALGIVFGAMASVTWTPMTNLLASPVSPKLAEVFSFREHSESNKRNETKDRRAA